MIDELTNHHFIPFRHSSFLTYKYIYYLFKQSNRHRRWCFSTTTFQHKLHLFGLDGGEEGGPNGQSTTTKFVLVRLEKLICLNLPSLNQNGIKVSQRKRSINFQSFSLRQLSQNKFIHSFIPCRKNFTSLYYDHE